MSGVHTLLAGNVWLAIAVAMTAFLLLFGGLQILARARSTRPETTRKLFHTGSGLLTLTFPALFEAAWPVFVLTGASALLVAAVKFVPALRGRYGQVANRVERVTLGELYFPVSVALLFWLTRAETPLLYVIPLLMLTLADATGALIGARYGRLQYHGASKSLEGSIAFAVVAFFCAHVPLLLWSSVGRTESLLIATTLSLLVMLLEGSAWRGLDNLFIPIGGYALLRVYLTLDTDALVARLLVTIALVALIVVVRHRTTMEDDSLVAGAFLCYVAWALLGWPWLVGPIAVAVGYRWLSPPTEENSRRMHAMPAMLSVWVVAVGWIVLARARQDPSLLLPYTTVFAAHLAMFGVSRLGCQYPEMPVPACFARAVAASWAIVMVPYLLTTTVDGASLAAAAGSLVAMAIGASVFVASQPTMRDVGLTAGRWIWQAAGAALASAVSWGIAAWVR